jgi:hypothetical protein
MLTFKDILLVLVDAQYITQRRLLHLTLVGVFGIKLVLYEWGKVSV